jgi:MFS family permease
VNIGNARIAGLAEDLVLTGNRYNIILLAFFPAYIIFEIPSNYILRRAGVARWLAFLVVGWGTLSMCSGFTTHWSQLVGLRFGIGAFEAGFAVGPRLGLSSEELC